MSGPGLARPGLLAAAALFVLAMLGAAPAPASATVFCVDAAGDLLANEVDPSCETPKAAIQEALTAAAANAGEDTVLIGPGDYTLPAVASGNEVEYSSGVAANVLHLRGIGDPHLTMGATTGTQFGLYVYAPAGSTVESLRLTIPANADSGGDTGIRLALGAAGGSLKIDGAEATNATGVNLNAGTELRESTVELPILAAPSNTAIAATSGDAGVVDSTLSGNTGVSTSGNVFTVERTTVHARNGTRSDSGTIVVRDSLIDLGTIGYSTGVALVNENAGSQALHATVAGATIVGGTATSTGVRVQADNGTETAAATISSTVIEGPGTPIRVLADNGREAEAVVTYSNYEAAATVVNSDLDGSGEAGLAQLLATDVTEFAPQFVDAAGGDFHLSSTSPLLDAGDPAAPAAEERDIDGEARAISALCPLAAGRRDIGADEYVPTCSPPVEAEAPAGGGEPGGATEPGSGAESGSGEGAAAATLPETAIAGKRRVLTSAKRAKIVVRLRSATAVGFRCSVDGKRYRPCGRRLVLRLKPGRHVLRARAVAADGSVDPTPAKLVVRVVKRKPRRR